MKNIQELIDELEKIKKEHGNLLLMTEYDASYTFGADVKVSMERNPDNYSGDKIKVLMVN